MTDLKSGPAWSSLTLDAMEPTAKELAELKDGLQAMGPDGRFLEVRGPMGMDLRVPFGFLLSVIRELEEKSMWLTMERDKALALSEETKTSAKQKSKAAGVEVAKLKSQLRKMHAAFAALDPSLVKESGEVDLPLVITMLKGTINEPKANVAARD
jgi:hypothetical protein